MLAAGGAVYLRGTRARSRRATFATVAFGAVLVLTRRSPRQLVPDPPSDRAFALRALVVYAVLAALAEWLDRSREPRSG